MLSNIIDKLRSSCVLFCFFWSPSVKSRTDCPSTARPYSVLKKRGYSCLHGSNRSDAKLLFKLQSRYNAIQLIKACCKSVIRLKMVFCTQKVINMQLRNQFPCIMQHSIETSKFLNIILHVNHQYLVLSCETCYNSFWI